MRKFILILFLIFSFQSLTIADDVRDLEISEISVGDSLLDYFTLETIKNGVRTDYVYKDDTFYDVEIYNHKSIKDYNGLSFSLKKNNKLYQIYQVVGFNFYEDNVDECFKKVDEVANEISEVLKNLNRAESERPHGDDPTGNSLTKQIVFWHESGTVFTECYDWSEKITKEKKWTDNFSVGIALKEYDLWLNNKAY